MAYSSFKASPKQFSYFRSLTGESLPAGCSKSQASRLIDQALKGTYQKKQDEVRVYSWQFSGLAAECLNDQMKAVKFSVDRNGRLEKTGFASLADAEAFARSAFPQAKIEVSTSVRQQYMD